MAIFSQKTLFVCNPYLGSFKQPLDQRYCNEKSLSMLVSIKNCFDRFKINAQEVLGQISGPGHLKKSSVKLKLANYCVL
jgi:hypothetical protein